MALETPNRMAASINFFFRRNNALPPPDDEFAATIVGIDGILQLEFPPDPIAFDPPSDGFYLELKEPVSSDEGIWFMMGAADLSGTTSLTPWVFDPDTGVDWADDRAASNGNFLSLFPDIDGDLGFVGVGIFKLPRTDADLPAIPLPLPCFIAGTLVYTPQGLIPIESLEVGHEVFSYDENSGRRAISKVVQTHTHTDRPVLELRAGQHTLIGTAEHPFYVVQSKKWIPMGELEPGYRLLLGDACEVAVDSITRLPDKATVHNITVDNQHNYFVGIIGPLVHNK